MSRAERNAEKREMQKIMKIINKLSPQQAKVMEIAAKERAQLIAGKYVSEVRQIIEDCTHSVLYDLGLDAIDITNRINALMIQESLYIEKEGIEVDKKLTREMLVNSARKYGLSSEGRKKIAKELSSTYATVTTYISKWKITEETLSKPVTKTQHTEEINEEDQDIKEAMEQISDILGEGKVMNNKIVEEVLTEADKTEKEVNAEEVTPVVVTKATVEQANLNPPINEEGQVKGLKVLEEIVVKTLKVEGENGIYEGETGKGVILSKENRSICFKTEEELNEWYGEFREVFARLKV